MLIRNWENGWWVGSEEQGFLREDLSRNELLEEGTPRNVTTVDPDSNDISTGLLDRKLDRVDIGSFLFHCKSDIRKGIFIIVRRKSLFLVMFDGD